MFSCLGLRTRFVCSHHEHGAVHNGCTSNHDRHQRFVTRGIDEGNDTLEFFFDIFFTIRAAPSWVELPILGFVECSVGVAEFNRDSTLAFFRVSIGPNTGQCLCQSGFTVVNVTDKANVDLRLCRKRSCHASTTPLSRTPSRVSLRCFFATWCENVGQGFVS